MPLASTEVKYEVHVSDGGRWTLFTDAATKGRAIQQAQQLLGSGKFDAAKVTEDRGQRNEILVWKEERQRVEKPETVVPINDAPACSSLADFYKFDARIAAGRLLREYLDNRSITVLELMHEYILMRELTRKEDFFFQAIRTGAAILARKRDKKPVEMVEFLEGITQQIQSRSEEPGDVDLDNALQGGLDRLADAVGSKRAQDERFIAIQAAVARRMRRWRDWEGKLVELLDIADKPATPENFAFADEAIAEILDGSVAVQELLGYQRNLCSAIQLLVRVSGGAYKLSEDTKTPLERLSVLLSSRPMPRTQSVLTERICRSLASTAPLTKGDRAEEQESFRTLVQQMIGSTMFVNSGPLCEAATLRAKSVLKDEFADESYENAIDDMIELLPTCAAKLGYLMDLLGTEYGKRAQEHIIRCIAGVLAGVTSVAQIFDEGATAEQIVRAAAGLRDRLLATNLPDEWRQRFAKRIYDLLVTYSTKGPTPAPAPAAKQAAAAAPKATAPAAVTKGNGDDRRLEVAAGGYIFQEGETGDRCFLVTSGSIEILKRAGDRDIVIGSVGAGEIIGEMAIIETAPRMASARASSDTVLTVISRDELSKRLERLEKFDPVMRRLMGMFVQRMRDFRFISADS